VLSCYGAVGLYPVGHVEIRWDEEYSNDLAIWPGLLVLFGAASSRSAGISLRNVSFHIDWRREEDVGAFLLFGRQRQ
jgi:hypothetical protein